MLARILIFTGTIAAVALAQESPPAAAEPAKPSVTKLDGTRYQIGAVTFDEKTREIRFPARVNMTEGLLEYLIVHQNGKVHEALLATEISPTHLNLAFTLLRYRPSRELYPLPNETGGTSGRFPEVPEDVKAAARVSIEVEWNDSGNVRRLPVNEWIQHGVKTTAMPSGPWVYGGSEIYQGKFSAETTGDVAAIFIAPSSLLGYPGTDNNNDDVWNPFPKRVPAEGTSVTVIIAPHQKQNSPPKP
jgi:hypothetical protein